MLKSGVVNIYKEKGYTSHDVVAIVRRHLGKIKTGHTGTLDPQAEGVLPVCIGKATKLSNYITAENKTYRAELILGIKTNTYDRTGLLVDSAKNVDLKNLEAVIKSFEPGYMQKPPMYSAIKVNGNKLYDLARKGVQIDTEPRWVQIKISIIAVYNNHIWLEIACSKGTYIRSLCHDIGEALGVGGIMGDLVRTQSGVFSISNSVKLQDFIKNKDGFIIPVHEVLPAKLGNIIKNPELAINGHTISIKNVKFSQMPQADEKCWIYTGDKLIGLYKMTSKETLKLEVMMYENN